MTKTSRLFAGAVVPRQFINSATVLALILNLFYLNSASHAQSPGQLDTSFGNGGIVVTELPGTPFLGNGTRIVRQADGKLVAAGFGGDGAHFYYILARYNENGTLDDEFGADGLVVTDPDDNSPLGHLRALAIDSQGRILAAGGRDYPTMARYLPNGDLDESFGSYQGLEYYNIALGTISSIALQSDGKIIAVGSVAGAKCAVFRLNQDGSRDYTYGGGLVELDFAIFERFRSVALDSFGRAIAVGDAEDIVDGNWVRKIVVARLNADGSMDSAFGSAGTTTIVDPNSISSGPGTIGPGYDVAIDSFERIVIATGAHGLMLVRILSDGLPDPSFDDDGFAEFPWHGGSSLRALSIQSDGKIVAAGTNGVSVVSRWLPDGTLDATFGDLGVKEVRVREGDHSWNDVLIEPNGSIVALGVGFNDVAVAPYNSMGVARFLGDNRPPVANAGVNQTVECTGDGTLVTLDGTGSFDPDGDPIEFEWSVPDGSGAVLSNPSSASPTGLFPMGPTLVTLTVNDGKGGVDVADVLITVQDTTPPVLVCTTDKIALWPPNHQMENVMICIAASDACSHPENLHIHCTLSSSEPDNSGGDGSTTGDVNGHDGYTSPVSVNGFVYDAQNKCFYTMVALRAERAGNTAGRVYSIVCDVSDSSNNSATASCVVVVPKNKKK